MSCINWKSESESHATSSDGKYSVWKWTEGNWISEVFGKARIHKSKEEAKTYCENQSKNR